MGMPLIKIEKMTDQDRSGPITGYLFKIALACLILIGSTFYLYNQGISSTLDEIKSLFENSKFALALEKSLNLLNTKEDVLTPAEGASLYFYIGMAYQKNGDNLMAADYLKKIEVKFPASSYVKQSYLELAKIYENDYFQKVAYLEKVFDGYPQTPEALTAGIELSRGYIQLKNFKKALPVLETIVNLWKMGDQEPEMYMLMAVAYSGINDYIEALDYLRKAEKSIPEKIESNPLYLFEAGKISHNNLNFEKGIVFLEKLFNVYPDYKDLSEVVILLAQCYERMNKLFLGAVFLIKAIEKKPPQRYIHTLFLALGRILAKLDEKELQKIQRNYPLYADARKLLTIVKNNSLDFEQRRTAAILLSDQFKKSENLGQVIENYHDFLEEKRDPLVEKLFKENLDDYLTTMSSRKEYEELFKAWLKLKQRKSFLSPQNLLKFGGALLDTKLYANAEEIFQHLLKYKMYIEYWPEALRQLVRIQFTLGRYNETLDNIDRLNLDKEPYFSEFNYYRLQSWHHLNQEDQIKTLLDTISFPAIANDFQYKISLMKAAQLEKEKKFDAALQIYQLLQQYQTLSENESALLMIAIADVYYRIGDYDTAAVYYQMAEKYNINLDWILFRQAKILLEKGKETSARKMMERLQEVNPNSFWLQQLQKDVRQR